MTDSDETKRTPAAVDPERARNARELGLECRRCRIAATAETAFVWAERVAWNLRRGYGTMAGTLTRNLIGQMLANDLSDVREEFIAGWNRR